MRECTWAVQCRDWPLCSRESRSRPCTSTDSGGRPAETEKIKYNHTCLLIIPRECEGFNFTYTCCVFKSRRFPVVKRFSSRGRVRNRPCMTLDAIESPEKLISRPLSLDYFVTPKKVKSEFLCSNCDNNWSLSCCILHLTARMYTLFYFSIIWLLKTS